MKWDIDRSLREFEPEILPGTIISRALVDVAILEKQGIRLTPEQRERQTVRRGLGPSSRPDA